MKYHVRILLFLIKNIFFMRIFDKNIFFFADLCYNESVRKKTHKEVSQHEKRQNKEEQGAETQTEIRYAFVRWIYVEDDVACRQKYCTFCGGDDSRPTHFERHRSLYADGYFKGA